MTNERTQAIALANRLLDEPNCDPDDDLRVLARQVVRLSEAADYLQTHHEQYHQFCSAIQPRAAAEPKADWCSLCGAMVTIPHEHFTPEHNDENRRAGMSVFPNEPTIELPLSQLRGLMNLLSNAKSFLATVETADSQIATRRDSIISDCEQWRDALLRKLGSPARTSAQPFKPGDRVQVGPAECETFGTVLTVGDERCSVQYDHGPIREPIFAIMRLVQRTE